MIVLYAYVGTYVENECIYCDVQKQFWNRRH